MLLIESGTTQEMRPSVLAVLSARLLAHLFTGAVEKISRF
jgi:hypothetical protein